MKNIRYLAVCAGAVLAVPVVQAPMPSAHAAETWWKVGTKISNPPFQDVAGWTFAPACPGSSGQEVSTAGVKLAGDLIYVLDGCKDGKSAVARVTVNSGPDAGDKRICRNSYGVGSWARCDWDWPEDPVKNLTAGTYDGDTGSQMWWDGGSIYFRH